MKHILRSLILVVALIFSAKSFSAEIKLTSFGRIDTSNTNMAAEVCGKIIGADPGNYVVQLKVDYNTKNPGYYHTITGLDGRFCEVVATNVGTIEATVETQKIQAKSTTQLK